MIVANVSAKVFFYQLPLTICGNHMLANTINNHNKENDDAAGNSNDGS